MPQHGVVVVALRCSSKRKVYDLYPDIWAMVEIRYPSRSGLLALLHVFDIYSV